MITRRNYLTITIVMFIVFFLFQFSNVALESWNHYEENSYITDISEIPQNSDSFHAEDTGAEDFAGDVRETVVYIGKEGDLRKTVSLWASYTKRRLETYLSPEEYEDSKEGKDQSLPAVIMVDSSDIDWGGEENCALLEKYVETGINLVFCNLPEVSVIEDSPRLKTLLGIETVRAGEMPMGEVYLHQGFLLGGEALYTAEEKEEGIEYTFPWYVVSSESEIYMNGIPKKQDLGTEPVEERELPAVIWKKDAGSAAVFAVNGSCMEDVAGLGILSAISAKMNPYEIYPVVNAQNMIYANYPGLADENEEFLEEHYSQSLEGLFQNVMWPDLVAVRRDNGLSLTCMLAPQFDYEDEHEPNGDQFQRYMKLLNEQRAETGLSGARISETPIEKKLAKDHEFMQRELPTYQFTSFYADGLIEEEVMDALREKLLGSVRTVVESPDDDKEVIGYLSEYVTRQSVIIDGFEETGRYDFRIRCLETALGYNSVMVDMKDIVYPEREERDWTFVSNTLWQNLRDHPVRRYGFDSTTVSECDIRIRRFLALDYKESREFNTIRLECNDTKGPVWFVLRTGHEMIESMEGGSWQELEEDVYLIMAEQGNVVITLKSVY